MTIAEAFQTAVQFHQAGRLAEAEGLFRQILAAQPQHAGALHHLGILAHQGGRHDLAADLIRNAILLDPNNPFAHSNLGEALRAMGRLDEAMASYRRALELKPDYPEAHYNLGNALRERDLPDQAIAHYRRAIALRPSHPDAHNNLAVALLTQGRLHEAIAAFRRAIELRPDDPQPHNNMGAALARLGQFDEALAAHRRALELRPDYARAHNNLGIALVAMGLCDEAVAAFHRAIEIQPGYSEAFLNLGNALREQSRLDEALAAYRRALELTPDYFEAHLNLGNVLSDCGQLDEALAAYRRARDLKPERPAAHSNLIYALLFYPALPPGAIAAEFARWNRQFSDPRKRSIPPYANDPHPERRLRIGYVSPDFREHVIGRYLVPLFQSHDRRNFEIFCYSDVTRPDSLTEEFRSHAHHWRNTAGVTDGDLADMIRQDGVDILVDLTQHLAGNRLPMFARHPAPVQVSFAGYPGSAGVEAIEYRISDPHLEPAASGDGACKEDQVCLIDSFYCYHPCGIEVSVNPLPALQTGIVTFGSMNSFGKVNEPVLSLWARLLRTVKGSRLLISCPAGSARLRTLETLKKAGLEAHRVEFLAFRPRRDYMELYHRLDVILDSFPYNGGFTTCDALWMGVPVVSLAGETPVSRAGLSLLTNLGLPEFIARSEEDYVRIAVELAGDLPRLAKLRSTLRSRMENSVLMDAARFARNIEAAYRTMWVRWCREGASKVNAV